MKTSLPNNYNRNKKIMSFKSIDQFNSAMLAEASRPQAFRDKLASIQGTATAQLEQFEREPLESNLDQVLTAQGLRLAAGATLEAFDRITLNPAHKR